MKALYSQLLIALIPVFLMSQEAYHVFPEDHKQTPGSTSGDGSVQYPWNLQTALNQSSEKVKDGDTIWLHEGIYNGRFVSTLKGSSLNKIVVAAYKNEKVVLNGNVPSDRTSVLEVRGGHVEFKNFEITFLDEFPRSMKDKGFKVVGGINHVSGEDCKFINLQIHNTPGSGFGSWKRAGGSTIESCIIFHNGYYSKRRGSGVGIYVQNESNKIRLIKNNIIFGNYYKGIEVWSDNSNAKQEYVKNITIDNNVLFNSGLPSGKPRDNLIIATNDNNGINIAKNIKVINNIFYHNTNLGIEIENTQAPSVTLGFNKKALVRDIEMSNNLIIGRKDAIRFLYIKSLRFTNNVVYSGYIRFNKDVMNHITPSLWKFASNTYYTRSSRPIRIEGFKDYSLIEWRSIYGIDRNSRGKNFTEFNFNSTINISKNEHKPNVYRVTLFNKEGKDVLVDFSNYQIKQGSTYIVKNIETDEVIISGKLSASKTVTVPMGNYNGTSKNFGVYKIHFSENGDVKNKSSILKRMFGWLF